MQLLKRAAALACSLALCASLMPAAVFADEETEETVTEQSEIETMGFFFPDAPSEQELADHVEKYFENMCAVKIDCTTDDAHDANYGLRLGDFKVGRVKFDWDQMRFTVRVDVDDSAYLDTYKNDYGDHEQTSGDAVAMLVWDGSKWVGQPTTISVKCTTPKAPSEEELISNVIEYFDGGRAVQITCDKSSEHAANYGLVAGAFSIGDVEYDDNTQQYVINLTIDADSYVTTYNETYSDDRGEHDRTSQNDVVAKLVWNGTNWKGTPAVINVTCNGHGGAPEAPTKEELINNVIEYFDGGRAVQITCDKSNEHAANYGLVAGAFSIGDVEYDDNTQQYVINLTIDADSYVTTYNETYSDDRGEHDRTSQSNVVAKLVWVNNAWVGVPATIYVTCDGQGGEEQPPKLPDLPEPGRLTDILGGITVECINDSAHKPYTVGAAGNGVEMTRTGDTTAEVTIYGDYFARLYSQFGEGAIGVKHTIAPNTPEIWHVSLVYKDGAWTLKYPESKGTYNFKVTCADGSTGSSCDHDYVWQHSPDEHWQYCNKCGQVISNGAHNFQWKDGYQECTVCGYRVTTTSTAASANNSANNGTAATAAGNTSTAAAATSVNGIPQTSDEMPLGLLAGSTVIAAAAFVALTLLRKRRQQ